MKLITVGMAVGLLALGACDQVASDPDIQEARTAIKGAMNDDGAALKEVREARAEQRRRAEGAEVGP